MKYVYGKRMKTLRDRLTTFVASLAILANSAGMALPFLLTQRVAADPMQSITMTRFSTYNEEQPSMGIAYQFSFTGFTDAKDADVYIERASGGTVIKSMRDHRVAEYINGKSATSGRIFVKEMPGQTEDTSSSWERVRYADGTPGNVQWTAATVPTFAWAVITNNDNTTVTSAKIPFTETYHGTTPYQDVLPNSPMITHIDAYYNVKTSPVGKTFKGIGVDFRTQFINAATNLELRINREDNSTFSATAKQSVLDAINGEAFKQTPTTRSGVITIQPGDYVGSWEQSATPWAGSSAPKSVDIIITLRDGSTLSLRDESISENIATQAEVLPAEPSLSFVANYIDNAQYGGISLEIVTPDLTDGMGVEITVDRTNGAPDTWSNKPAGTVMPALNGGSHTVTAPIVIAEKTRTRTSSSSWQTTGEPWTSDQEPTSVTVRVTRAGGPTLEQTVSLIGSPWGATWPQIAAQLPTPDTTAPIATLSLTGGKVVNGKRFVRPGDTLKYTVVATDDDSGLDRAANIVFRLAPNGATQQGVVCGSWHNGKFPSGSNTRTGSFTMTSCNGGTAPEDRLYGLAIRVYDNAGNNLRIPNEVFAVDGTKPVVSNFNTPGLVSDTLSISADATDATSGVEYTRFFIAETQAGECKNNLSALPGYLNVVDHQASGEYSTSFDTSALNGEYCVLASARDNATNNSVPLFKKITIDNTAPAAPTNLHRVLANSTVVPCGAVIRPQVVTPTWTASSSSDVAYYEYSTSNPNGTPGLNKRNLGNTTSFNTNGWMPTEGVGTYFLRTVDHAGNMSDWVSCSITYDETTPETEILSASIDNDSLSFTGNVSDDNLRYYYCWLTTNQVVTVDGHTYTPGQEVKLNGNTDSTRNAACNTTWANGETSFTGTIGGFNITGFPAGSYTINLVAYDLAGNSNVGNPAQYVVILEEDESPTLSADYFTVHDDHLGVGFTPRDFTDATLVTVEIFDADNNPITTNTGNSADILALLNSNLPDGMSSPFYIPFGDATDGYWTFGDANWATVTPAYAIVTINYGSGASLQDRVDFTPVNPDTNDSYDALVAALSTGGNIDGGEVQGTADCDGDGITDPNGCENGNGSRASAAGTNDILNRAQGGQVLAATTGLAGTGTQNGGILALLATSIMAIALLTIRRKQES